MDYMSEYKRWLDCSALSADEHAELAAVADNQEEIESRFFAPLSFGTAGLRGVLGVGLNRMNRFTVGQAAQGLANLIVSNGQAAMDRGVAIAYDSRHFSAEFAKQSACIMAANGIQSLLFDELRPTPELSFAVRHYGCIAGINITASHNPKEYNGYKVYWEDGAQLPPAEADVVASEMAKTDIFTGVKTADYDESVKNGLIRILSKETDEAYLSEVIKVAVNPDCVKQVADEFKLVYTPFHGAGYRLVPEILRRLGYKHIICEPEQMKIDGDFPTVKNPNPEYKEGFTLAIELAKQNDVDLIIGTDPDSDRTGIVLKDKSGEYVTLSGNQVGVLLTDYIITAKKLTNTMPAHPAVLKSIVTTEMARAAAEKNGVECFDTFTGFKFLAEKIKQFEQDGSHEYIFAFEESYGYLCGDYARDKDAVTASMLIVEMACWYASQNMTLFDALGALYEKYGYYKDTVKSIGLKGIEGLAKIQEIMNTLRDQAPQEIGAYKVTAIRDYKKDTVTDLATGKVTPTGLPASNVLYYEMTDGAWVCVRPSGTEPKVKFYLGVKGTSLADADQKSADLSKAVHAMIDKML